MGRSKAQEAGPKLPDRLSRNFLRSEFRCNCGKCCFDRVSITLVNYIQLVRDALGEAIRINSGCRCDKWNAKVGGVKGSSHMLGLAADLSCKSGSEALAETIKRLYTQGKLPSLSLCMRYVKSDFVHLDIDGSKKRANRFVEVPK
jgi:uncharacterized protein YcbK (DUF882 family)